ncbi:hypothetical protein PILCRDRAFT_27 [Piloderma croceum F 1598]|uniref:Uncharacterized protein n=1 Tax=Piloderma croceum (strain F 1598) TaxID=765440 RepID=A0A0C3G6G1_PILCF|nr:hypothetical protein PILCRDRAFT_27 [Piloderma croceum F 1598]
MVLFHSIKQKLMCVRYELSNESGSVVSHLIDVEPGDTSPDITNPVLAPPRQHWDNVLADTVSVVGCQCTFCSLRSTHEVTERGRRKRQARVVLPPRSSVLDILYRFPSNEFQGGDSMLSSSSSASNMAETQRPPSHRRVVGIPEFEQSAPSSQDVLNPPGIPDQASPPPYSAYDAGLPDNQATPRNTYDILGPYSNPSNSNDSI